MDYIKHHGVEDQQWGVRNGPPYPLDNAKAMAQRIINRMKVGEEAVNNFLKDQKDKKISEIKLSDDAKIITKNVDLFTTQELQDKINRQRMIKELQNNIPKKEGFIKKTMSGITNGLSSKISNAIVDKIIGSITDSKNSFTYKEAVKIAEDFKNGKAVDGQVKRMTAQEMEQLFKLINNTNSIDKMVNQKDNNENSKSSSKNTSSLLSNKDSISRKQFRKELDDLMDKGYLPKQVMQVYYERDPKMLKNN